MPADRPERPGAGIGIDLSAPGAAVRNEFLPAARIAALVGCATLRRERGDFNEARIGAGPNLRRREAVRGDSTCWWDEPLLEPERAWVANLESLRLDLNREAFLGLVDHELHYAWYPPGAGYARHVDQPQGRVARRVSFILYLNEAWQPGDGGELRIFDGTGGHRDIEPVAGRLVCFLSAGLEHAVLPTRVDRLSLTGWFRGRQPMP